MHESWSLFDLPFFSLPPISNSLINHQQQHHHHCCRKCLPKFHCGSDKTRSPLPDVNPIASVRFFCLVGVASYRGLSGLNLRLVLKCDETKSAQQPSDTFTDSMACQSRCREKNMFFNLVYSLDASTTSDRIKVVIGGDIVKYVPRTAEHYRLMLM